MSARPASHCSVNDIADVRIDLGRRTSLDRFRDQRSTGALVLVDAISGASLAAGVVNDLRTQPETASAGRFVISRDMLARGLCRVLGSRETDRAEFERRLAEVALILRAAGVDAEVESEGEAADRFDPVI